MATATWNPWTDIETFARELHRVFDPQTSQPTKNGNGHQESWKPSMDVRETDVAYVIDADVPGMTIQDITVELEGTTLTIAGERKKTSLPPSSNYTHVERTFGIFRRTFTLPAAVKVDDIEAAYINGVLTVTVPKADLARTRRINVQAV